MTLDSKTINFIATFAVQKMFSLQLLVTRPNSIVRGVRRVPQGGFVSVYDRCLWTGDLVLVIIEPGLKSDICIFYQSLTALNDLSLF